MPSPSRASNIPLAFNGMIYSVNSTKLDHDTNLEAVGASVVIRVGGLSLVRDDDIVEGVVVIVGLLNE